MGHDAKPHSFSSAILNLNLKLILALLKNNPVKFKSKPIQKPFLQRQLNNITILKSPTTICRTLEVWTVQVIIWPFHPAFDCLIGVMGPKNVHGGLCAAREK
jgi:hypothetical protein